MSASKQLLNAEPKSAGARTVELVVPEHQLEHSPPAIGESHVVHARGDQPTSDRST
ncbi:hypothetical protein [Gordonia sp. (in: high G+C Gram-positive bacteria)]|uniref:hypothetical protein n=1 Tax=Gordonia sp. (in: high G+C Gram-positive bacteria) TaxID=84139 RepID=UPI001D265E16|nr:hypothetical protein [Gordonia sp. (in: high G+C Gram-positive bacteria)]MCB1293307.1 hypothetical protein [Gordonia sp. (in: high G+C Gram-positive bacteria)]HQV18373.1 hypothetical protein [Gordonia sp. (in: high G+C Gram-positive bacteria)]